MFLKVTIPLAGIVLLLISMAKAQSNSSSEIGSEIPDQGSNGTVECLRSCPNKTIPVNNRCYMFPDEAMTWYDASKYCQNRLGFLLLPDFPIELLIRELSYVYPKLSGNYRNSNFWVGASNTGSDIVLKWENGTQLPRNHPSWRKGHPPSATSLCVSIFKIKFTLLSLITKDCNEKSLFICQFNHIWSPV
ncbi:Snaclec trimecetin subunit beta [Armadillidium nasatum]|uniref:Snaclec trimecetin subunit beta n=1 Tax=Armadillidium nasatum TaxID=96803 RepID=A0A5N5SYC3_9CRUS|nr:Snaclec trimecetin subunit beta [Armadillidium nasatum]